ncbi:hypothetical protein AB0L62_15740 [Nocardia asteroides]|uniref:hypothetical protein n=1 Tax=Nocardia asteroides TaxID=1824 RepID=UPI00343C108B
MHQIDIGALSICDGEGHPVGIVTDRDIVVKIVALGENPATTTAWRTGARRCAGDRTWSPPMVRRLARVICPSPCRAEPPPPDGVVSPGAVHCSWAPSPPG